MQPYINFFKTGITSTYGITSTTGIGLPSSETPSETAAPITEE
jgi:hypothetical protein